MFVNETVPAQPHINQPRAFVCNASMGGNLGIIVLSGERIYLNCPFDEKDECKSLGARWDGDERKWYITGEMDTEPFAQWMIDDAPSGQTQKETPSDDEGEKTYLNCPFDDKEECKALGGRWDGDAKKWYVPAGKDTEPFSKWL